MSADPALPETPAGNGPILIWGGGDFAEDMFHLAQEAGFRVAGFVPFLHALTCDHGLPRLTPGQVAGDPALAAMAILVAARNQPPDRSDPAPFQAALNEIVLARELPNRVLHPCAVVGRLLPAGALRACYFGFQGSGNVVCGEILRRLLDGTPPPPRAALFRALATEFDLLLDLAVAEALAGPECRGTEIQANRVGRKLYMLRIGERSFLHLADVPSFLFSYVLGRYFGSHERLQPDTLATLRRQGCGLLLTWRHPLDVIVSCAGKIDETPQKPASVLADLNWFHAVAADVHRYYGFMNRYRDELEVVRYEDLLRHPVATIQRLATLAGVAVEAAEAAAIWQEVGLRPLPNAPAGHFWEPGTEKWRQHLGDAHFRILRELGYEEMLRQVGYPTELPASPAAPEAEAKPGPAETAPPAGGDRAKADYHLHPAALVCRQVLGEITITSNDAELAARAERALRSPGVSRLLMAGNG